MEEEIEDLIGEVQYTDSQNTMDTSNVYPCEYTDSSSEKNNSSGKDTYVLDCDDSDDSEKTYELNQYSVVDLYKAKVNRDAKVQCETKKINRAAETSFVAQETFTQTSKTIIELAQAQGYKDQNSLETQTSRLSITESKTIQYKIEYTTNKEIDDNQSEEDIFKIVDDTAIDSVTNEITDNLTETKTDKNISYVSDEFEDSANTDSDFDKDSLMDCSGSKRLEDNLSETSEVPRSIDNDVEELYKKLSETMSVNTPERSDDLIFKVLGHLTPLTEESTIRKESIIDITPMAVNHRTDGRDVCANALGGFKVSQEVHRADSPEEQFRLPPIHKNQSCPNSPHLNALFNINSAKQLAKAETLPCLFESTDDPKWPSDCLIFSAGENFVVRTDEDTKDDPEPLTLPPIHGEGHYSRALAEPSHSSRSEVKASDMISINDRIKELKAAGRSRGIWTKCRSPAKSTSRNCSPGHDSKSSPTRSEAAERGSEVLCTDILRKLKANNWVEVADTLEDLPKAMDKFWHYTSETRIADLLRQVGCHIESPRTQVARSACSTLAAILKNTNYTKKPEFYEAVTALLVKTGSYNRAVRRAANVALDEIVCSVDVWHAVTALSVHGVPHKSPLVRCASARLLVVCAAMSGGGRELLKTRPASVAGARKHLLRSMALLLDDKNTDTRKFAERLYAMLRPLSNFEAFYLTDVEVETASRHIKKYDPLLTHTTSEAR